MKQTTGPVWHANGTVVMGKADDPSACVDQQFHVYGIQRLRVADLSVSPLTVK
jgi:choline dehydrogenase-like flavoprotein